MLWIHLIEQSLSESFRTWSHNSNDMKDPLLDYGTPEEEAWRWKFVPLYIRSQRKYDTYLWKAKYYDHPEGEDLVGKLVATNRILLPIGFIIGAADALMHKNLNGFQKISGRILHWTWPFAGIATAFTATTYFGAKLREKDDLYVNGYLISCCLKLFHLRAFLIFQLKLCGRSNCSRFRSWCTAKMSYHWLDCIRVLL